MIWHNIRHRHTHDLYVIFVVVNRLTVFEKSIVSFVVDEVAT
jgi:hypothetical protein